MICKNCGTENEEGNVFCMNCGSRVTDTGTIEPSMPAVSQPDEKEVASQPYSPADAPAPAPVPSPAPAQPAYQQPQPIYAPPPVAYQQPVAPPPPPPPVMPQAPKGPPDTCRILRMPTAPDMPGLSFFDGTVGQYFGYMILFGFLNMLVVAMPVILMFVGGGMTSPQLVDGVWVINANIDLANMSTMYIILMIVTAVLALLVSLIVMSWMYTVLLRWMSHHTIVNDHRLVFVGRPAELLKKIVIYWLLTMITFGIFAIWIPVKLLRWKAAHTRFAT